MLFLLPTLTFATKAESRSKHAVLQRADLHRACMDLFVLQLKAHMRECKHALRGGLASLWQVYTAEGRNSGSSLWQVLLFLTKQELHEAEHPG